MTETATSPSGEIPDAALAAAQPEAPALPQINFWRQAWVQSVIPWTTSLTIHISIITVALVLLTSGVFHELIQKVTQPQVNVPTAMLAETNVGSLPNVGTMDDVTSQSAQLDPVEQTRNPLPDGQEDEIAALMRGTEGGAASITGITGMGSLADALGGGGGGEGSAVFGEPGGGGKFMGFDFGRAGDGSAVNRVIFVCDASGSMEGQPKALLIKELKKTLAGLKPIQFFNLFFFSDASYDTCFPDGMRPANPRSKEQTFNFLDRLAVHGGTDPIPALDSAFKQKPQLIFFLSDGRFDQAVNYDQVLESIRLLNPDKQVMINTIQFMNRDEKAEEILRRIAAENGGKYRFIGEDDL
jgi:hypothetical protein